MRTLLMIAILVAGCGNKKKADEATSSPNPSTPAPTSTIKVDRAGHPPAVSDAMLDAMDAYLVAWESLARDLATVQPIDCAKATAIVEKHAPAVHAASEVTKQYSGIATDDANKEWFMSHAASKMVEVMKLDGGVVKECNVTKDDKAFSKAFMDVMVN